MQFKIAAAVFGACALFSSPTFAQEPAAIAPAEALKDGWEEIDQRLLFLMVRLANVEASLDAVEDAISKSFGKRASSLGAVKRAEAGNERMDRQGGGPMKWSEFYGRTAEKFFYHPVDRNSTYHTETALRQIPGGQNGPGGGVPTNQGTPAHQRPPQFDYIYRANRGAKARAEQEAGQLQTKINSLLARRVTLEAEQTELWCEVAFRTVTRHDLERKALYRFQPLLISAETKDRQRAEAVMAAATFLRVALLIIDEADKDQATVFANIKPAIATARERLDDGWVRNAAITADVGQISTPVGKFAALAKRLEDIAANLSESYGIAIDADQEKDRQRKETFRLLLQNSVVNYAEIVLAMNEMAMLMATEWKVTPDVDKPLAVTLTLAKLERNAGASKAITEPASASNRGPSTPAVVPLKERLAGTKWINTNEFVFEWDQQGKLWHCKDGGRSLCKCVYLGPNRVRITFINNIVHTLVFDEDFAAFSQVDKSGKVANTAKRFK